LVRTGFESKLPQGAVPVFGNAFDAGSFENTIPSNSIFIQLLGVPHPGPKKKEFFKSVDLASAKASAAAAKKAGASHFIYISVAQTPTKIMKDYQECRAAGEAAIRETGLAATFIRPWYVIGPGHYWPVLFQPIFKVLEMIPSTRQKAKALRVVYLKQILNVLTYSVENTAEGIRIIEIEEIRKF